MRWRVPSTRLIIGVAGSKDGFRKKKLCLFVRTCRSPALFSSILMRERSASN
jgi:hypothetical protein